jgi:hypothetical protein
MMKKFFETPIPSGPGEMPEIPTIGLGDVASVYGDATVDAIKECLRENPLAGLDPRFPLRDQDIGRILAPRWWENVLDYLELEPPPLPKGAKF